MNNTENENASLTDAITALGKCEAELLAIMDWMAQRDHECGPVCNELLNAQEAVSEHLEILKSRRG